MWKVMERNRITGDERLIAEHKDYEVAKRFMRQAQRSNEYTYNLYIYLKEDSDG